ncbi:tetratricopeptide repeat protein [Aquibium sp. LZ166]|uniref:Tetratricopeptide repeat protein n=1 Tax=Aquibium pacificus TaxID=3153579 RepID=A0ABV3SGR5_9HYPH
MARQRRKPQTGEQSARPDVRARIREYFSLPNLETRSTSLRTVFLNALFLLMLVILLPVLVSQFRREQVIIEPIAVPDAMAAQGLTAEVAASRLWDGLHDVVVEARTAKESITALPDSRRVEFSFPDSGFSFESLIYHLRRLFNAYETRIAGEFVCATPECGRDGMQLRLRIVRGDVEIVDLPPVGERPERSYFREAAAGVMAVLDPFVAIAASSEKEPLRATILARKLIRSHHKDAKWAHNLIGNIRTAQGDLPAAIAEYRAALELDPDFVIARTNLGNVLRESGDADGARAAFDAAARLDPKDVRAVEGYAELAIGAGDVDGAVRYFTDAAALDPLNPHYFARAGRILMDAGRGAEAEAMLARALEIDPGYLPAFAFLAAGQLVREDYAAAEKTYRDAADYAPSDAEAQIAHGRILTILKRCDEALVRFDRAIALDAASVEPRLQKARCLQRLERQEEALAVLGEAQALDPANAEIYLSMGDGLRDTGRKEEAVAAYRKFLELDTDSPMRPVAEKFIELLSG